MGSGKSSVGNRLANILSVPFLDLDTQIEHDTKLSIPEIFKTKGELFFRKKEQEVLQQLLENDTSFVLATGGGTPCYGTVMQQINETENTTSIFLHATIETLTQRLFPERASRPLIAHLETQEAVYDFVRKHIFERNFYYLQADRKVDANKDISEIISEIVLQLF